MEEPTQKITLHLKGVQIIAFWKWIQTQQIIPLTAVDMESDD